MHDQIKFVLRMMDGDTPSVPFSLVSEGDPMCALHVPPTLDSGGTMVHVFERPRGRYSVLHIRWANQVGEAASFGWEQVPDQFHLVDHLLHLGVSGEEMVKANLSAANVADNAAQTVCRFFRKPLAP